MRIKQCSSNLKTPPADYKEYCLSILSAKSCKFLKNTTFAAFLIQQLNMELKEIVAIAGIGGLHKIIGRTKSGLILESLNETRKRFATGIQDKVSVLEDISMYTEEGDVHLSEVFRKIHEIENTGAKVPSYKDDPKAIRSFVNDAVKLDNERVYDSDIKKLINWYALLKGIVDFATLGENEAESEKKNAEGTEEVKPKAKKTAVAKSETTEEKPKKSPTKKAAAKKTDTDASVKPKTTARKKKSDD